MVVRHCSQVLAGVVEGSAVGGKLGLAEARHKVLIAQCVHDAAQALQTLHNVVAPHDLGLAKGIDGRQKLGIGERGVEEARGGGVEACVGVFSPRSGCST